MRQMGIKAQWVKSYTQPAINSDFSTELIILDYNLPVSFLAGFNALNNIPMLHFVEIILHAVNFLAQFSYYFFLSDIVLLFDCRQYVLIFFRQPDLGGTLGSLGSILRVPYAIAPLCVTIEVDAKSDLHIAELRLTQSIFPHGFHQLRNALPHASIKFI